MMPSLDPSLVVVTGYDGDSRNVSLRRGRDEEQELLIEKKNDASFALGNDRKNEMR